MASTHLKLKQYLLLVFIACQVVLVLTVVICRYDITATPSIPSKNCKHKLKLENKTIVPKWKLHVLTLAMVRNLVCTYYTYFQTQLFWQKLFYSLVVIFMYTMAGYLVSMYIACASQGNITFLEQLLLDTGYL